MKNIHEALGRLFIERQAPEYNWTVCLVEYILCFLFRNMAKKREEKFSGEQKQLRGYWRKQHRKCYFHNEQVLPGKLGKSGQHPFQRKWIC